MAVMKCKMCGGDLQITAGMSVAECEFCGTKQTLPKANDEILQNLFNRANNLRIKCEFDKAEQVYEKILQENEGESEAHWGIVLCKYGIEYVEDPKTYKRIPTCHRTSYDAVITDADYLAAVAHADDAQKELYEAEAKAIDSIQKNILSIVKNEKPFDVFICYKESDENGKRTVDSAIANDIYYQLTQEGLKVFYAAITLEDKLGQAYEPYIFAALNSAKVMLVIGTKPQYFTAVWVKNEWSRFLKLMKTDRSKLLIPCYKDMDAYDLPEEFAHLQAQDMSKIGFISDVVRGIRKVAATQTPKAAPVQQTPAPAGNANIAPLLKRAFMFLEDGNWTEADNYCEKVLDNDPENAQAYLGKLMAELKIKKQENLKNCAEPFSNKNNYQKAIRFADAALKTKLEEDNAFITERNEKTRIGGIYIRACGAMSAAKTEKAFKEAAQLFRSIRTYKDSAEMEKSCENRAEIARNNSVYAEASSLTHRQDIRAIEKAIGLFQSISGWKDADAQILACRQQMEKIKAENEKQRQKEEKKKKMQVVIAAAVLAAIAIAVAVVALVNNVIIPNGKYNDAVALMDAGKYTDAIAAFEALEGYNDSEEKILECKYKDAIALMDAGKKQEAAIRFTSLSGYKDAKERSLALWEEAAVRDTLSAGNHYTSGLKADGTVVAVGYNYYGQCDVSGWQDTVAISSGSTHTVGLKADGTVVAVGNNLNGRCDVNDWQDIVAISADGGHTVGLKADGTVVAVGSNYYGQCDISDWQDIVAISAGGSHTVGLKADGTVVAVGDNDCGQCDVSDWQDIVAISAGNLHTLGLKADGTVVAVGANGGGQCDVSDWQNIVAISAGYGHAAGLKADGTVVAVGKNNNAQCNVRGWQDIVAISAGVDHTVGLKADGTVVAVGSNDDGQCNAAYWSGIKLPK